MGRGGVTDSRLRILTQVNRPTHRIRVCPNNENSENRWAFVIAAKAPLLSDEVACAGELGKAGPVGCHRQGSHSGCLRASGELDQRASTSVIGPTAVPSMSSRVR